MFGELRVLVLRKNNVPLMEILGQDVCVCLCVSFDTKEKQPFMVLLSVSLFPSPTLVWDIMINEYLWRFLSSGPSHPVLFMWKRFKGLLLSVLCGSWRCIETRFWTCCSRNSLCAEHQYHLSAQERGKWADTLSLWACWRLPTVWLEVSRMVHLTTRTRII